MAYEKNISPTRPEGTALVDEEINEDVDLEDPELDDEPEELEESGFEDEEESDDEET